MPKKETSKEIAETETKETIVLDEISLITETFGNGDLNILRDKINEIIKRG